MATTALVGRTGEQALVAALVERTAARDGGVLLLEGEAGIGKSALLDLAGTLAWSSGCVLLRGSADQLEGSRPFGVLADALGGLGPDAGREVVELAQTEGASMLDVMPPARFRVLDAVVDRLRALDEPVLLVLDDLHWADPATTFAVAALGRRAADLGIGVLAAFRPTPRPPELDRLVDVLGGATVVGALDEAETAALLGSAVGTEPGPRLRALAARAGGNPLLLLELVEAARDEGRLTDGEVVGSGVPSSLRASVARRVRGLGDDAAEVLRMAAILGQSFTIDELAVVSGRPVRELFDPLRHAIAAGLLRETASGLGFRHDLVREAVADETPAAIRAALHRDAARVLAAAGAPLERVAAHLVRGATKGDAEAVAVLAQAAARAAPAAPAAALDLVDAALAVADDDDPNRPALAAHRAELLVWTGRPAEAIDAVTAVLPQLDGAVAGNARATRSQALFMLGRPREAIDSWLADRAAGGDGAESDALGQAAGALASLFASDVGAAVDGADRALELTVGSRDRWVPAATAVALATRSWCRAVAGRFAEALADSAEAVRVADADPMRAGHRYHPNVMRAMVLASNADHDASLDAVADGQRIGRELGTAWDRPVYHWIRASVRFRTGDWDAALADVDAGRALAEESGVRVGIGWPFGAAALIALHRGDPEGAGAWLAAGERSMAEHSQQLGQDWLLWARALVTEAEGDVAGAQRLLGLVADVAARLGAPAMACVVAPDLTRLSRVVGDDERVASTVALVSSVADVARAPVIDAVALRCCGLATGDPALLAEAAALLRAAGRRPEHAAACAEGALAAAAAGDDATARSLGKASLEQLHALGATAGVARTRAELRTFGVRIRLAEPTRPEVGWDALTATECDVVAHIVRGLSNGEIAERLRISRRTVESHLAHVYAKVGVSGRAALAVAAATRDP